MARNRKRAKERRARQPVATRRTNRQETPPDPIEHATPDVELAEAQLAMGSPALPEDLNGELAEEDGVVDADGELIEQENGEVTSGQIESAGLPAARDVLGLPSYRSGGSDAGRAEARGVAVGDAVVPAPARLGAGSRLVGFLQGSWNELQRVQWPDRRQVLQATGVVIGFVIVAGIFLGVADALAAKLVNYILK